jgi:hypothetical protein
MPKAFSLDLRERVAGFVEVGRDAMRLPRISACRFLLLSG